MAFKSVVADEVFEHKKWKKKIVWKLLGKKNFRNRFFHSDFFYHEILNASPIPRTTLHKLVQSSKVSLENFFSRNGNLSPYEVMAIAALIADRRPMRLLEIGTFDGNTTLQMALNAPMNALIHTIDLPPDRAEIHGPVLKSDLVFIYDELKKVRKFQNTLAKTKIKQHFGDSTRYPFSSFIEDGRMLDFIFIDGGHSFECVKSDTENALRVLNKKGCILWHDFTPHFEGVFRYLSLLSQEIPLVHIEGTNFVFHES